MIGLSKQTSDATNGAIILKQSSDRDQFSASARISHSPTLDGACVLVNSGFSECDRKISVTAKVRKAKEDKIKTFFRNETLVTIAAKDGCYSGAIQRVKIKNGTLVLSLVIKEKLSS